MTALWDTTAVSIARSKKSLPWTFSSAKTAFSLLSSSTGIRTLLFLKPFGVFLVFSSIGLLSWRVNAILGMGMVVFGHTVPMLSVHEVFTQTSNMLLNRNVVVFILGRGFLTEDFSIDENLNFNFHVSFLFLTQLGLTPIAYTIRVLE